MHIMKKDVHTPSVRIEHFLYGEIKAILKLRKGESITQFVNDTLEAHVKKLRQERLLELFEKSSVEKVQETIESVHKDLRKMENRLQRERDALMSRRK